MGVEIFTISILNYSESNRKYIDLFGFLFYCLLNCILRDGRDLFKNHSKNLLCEVASRAVSRRHSAPEGQNYVS